MLEIKVETEFVREMLC